MPKGEHNAPKKIGSDPDDVDDGIKKNLFNYVLTTRTSAVVDGEQEKLTTWRAFACVRLCVRRLKDKQSKLKEMECRICWSGNSCSYQNTVKKKVHELVLQQFLRCAPLAVRKNNIKYIFKMNSRVRNHLEQQWFIKKFVGFLFVDIETKN